MLANTAARAPRPRPVPGFTHHPAVEPVSPWGPNPTGRALFDKARDAARSQLGSVHAAAFDGDSVTISLADYAALAGAR